METMRDHSFRRKRLLLESDVTAYFEKLLCELEEFEHRKPTTDYDRADGRVRLDCNGEAIDIA